MTLVPSRGMASAAVLAVAMHLLLFMLARPSDGNGLAGMLVPPETRCLAKPPPRRSKSGGDVRTVWSPVLFSLPSKVGFSRELMQDDLRTRLSFTRQIESESFLEVDPASRGTGPFVVPRELMLTAGANAGPRLPAGMPRPLGNQASARRVHVSPELKERLLGGVVLPPGLNKEGAASWEIRAEIAISRQGVVEHVFLEQPLEADSLNQALIRLLYGLRFKSGDTPVEGGIEIYSPESAPAEGANQ